MILNFSNITSVKKLIIIPGRSILASTIIYKHCRGRSCSRETACNEISGYSSENPCCVLLSIQETTLQIKTHDKSVCIT